MKAKLKFIHWLPRILCIPAILFVSIFALDAFQPDKTPGQQILAFLIHLIPSFILALILIVAWKWERIGGIIFILIGLVFTPIIYTHNYQMNQSIWLSLLIVALIPGPFIIVGMLFLWNHHLKKQHNQPG